MIKYYQLYSIQYMYSIVSAKGKKCSFKILAILMVESTGYLMLENTKSKPNLIQTPVEVVQLGLSLTWILY